MNLDKLKKITDGIPETDIMPALFIGHGNPMNAIEDNEFVDGFKRIGQEIRPPKAILCISAHWETLKGTYVTVMSNPRTIHDFGGFPKALYDVQYPAPGSPELTQQTKELVTSTEIGLHDRWGLDHGAWSILRHMYPQADIPVIQMSLDRSQPASYHYKLAQEISSLRKKGILIIGSGNMVHNIRMMAPKRPGDTEETVHDWALEANSIMKSMIQNRDHTDLINYHNQGLAFKLSIPTAEHYLPMLYTLGVSGKKEEIQFFNDKVIGGAASMTSLKI